MHNILRLLCCTISLMLYTLPFLHYVNKNHIPFVQGREEDKLIYGQSSMKGFALRSTAINWCEILMAIKTACLLCKEERRKY